MASPAKAGFYLVGLTWEKRKNARNGETGTWKGRFRSGREGEPA